MSSFVWKWHFGAFLVHNARNISPQTEQICLVFPPSGGTPVPPAAPGCASTCHIPGHIPGAAAPSEALDPARELCRLKSMKIEAHPLESQFSQMILE